MNTLEIKLNEPLTLNFTGPKGDVFKMIVSCDETVVIPPVVPPTSDISKKAETDVKPIVDAMIAQQPDVLRNIGTAYYTLKLSNIYTVDAASTALTKLVGYEPAAFIVVFNNAPETDRPEVCNGIIHAIQTALIGKGLPGIY